MTIGITIRPIRETDSPGFRQAVDSVARERLFLRRFVGPTPEGAAAFVRSTIENGHPQFVAVHNAIVVGWCDVVRGHVDGESHSGQLGMGVVAPWRGQGIGRRLIEATLAAADAANLLRVELSVHADNANAINLYRSVGFVEEGRQIKARMKPDGFVDVILMARLAPDAHWQLPSF